MVRDLGPNDAKEGIFPCSLENSSPLDLTRNQIRLLHLSPALEDEDEIKCTFSYASLDEESDYEALSYVWGSIDDTVPIQLEGSSIQITKNLYAALKHLRLRNRERRLWVDALCIDQSELNERQHQVACMGSIYGQASQVVVWLGEAWNGSDLAMDFLQRSGEDGDLHIDRRLTPSLDVDGVGLESIKLCDYLILFFNLPWWKRLWTVQEFVLAQHIVFQCGKRTLSGELVWKSIEHIWKHDRSCCHQVQLFTEHGKSGVSLGDFLHRVSRLENVKKRYKNDSFLLTVTNFRTRQATDPRDKIYGMLGLATGQYEGFMEPDYTLPPERVFEIAALASAERTGKLDFLSHLYGERNSQLPSYVPDWTNSVSQPKDHRARMGYLEVLNTYRASGLTSAELRVLGPGKVATRALLFDKIKTVGPIPGSIANKELLNEMLELAGISHSLDAIFNTREINVTAFWQTMFGGLRRIRNTADLTEYHRYDKWHTWFITEPSDNSLFDHDVRRMNRTFNITSACRRFIITEKGYFGWAPEKSEKGDIVALLPGGSVPYILRGTTIANHLGTNGFSSNSCYNVIGDSYIHGVMFGEVFTQHSDKLVQICLV